MERTLITIILTRWPMVIHEDNQDKTQMITVLSHHNLLRFRNFHSCFICLNTTISNWTALKQFRVRTIPRKAPNISKPLAIPNYQYSIPIPILGYSIAMAMKNTKTL